MREGNAKRVTEVLVIADAAKREDTLKISQPQNLFTQHEHVTPAFSPSPHT